MERPLQIAMFCEVAASASAARVMSWIRVTDDSADSKGWLVS